MSVRAVVLSLGALVLAACSMPTTVESELFPDVEIECGGESGLSADGCLTWAEQMISAAPPRAAGGEDISVTKVVLTFRTGNSRCAADYLDKEGRLMTTMSTRCPAP